jgi:nitroreductase
MEIFQAVTARRSIRRFRPDPVPEALLREIIPIPETRAIIVGTALGYPDAEAPVNQFTRERANPDEFTLWFK